MSRPDSPQWLAAKAEGDRAELEVAKWFRQRGWEPFKAIGCAAFDLLLQCSVEVKHDRRAEQTNQVAIEVSRRGTPSGILTSTAAYWVMVVGEVAFIVKTADLRTVVLRGDLREVPAGDDLATRVVLLPLERLRKIKGVQIVRLDGPDAEPTA